MCKIYRNVLELRLRVGGNGLTPGRATERTEETAEENSGFWIVVRPEEGPSSNNTYLLLDCFRFLYQE